MAFTHDVRSIWWALRPTLSNQWLGKSNVEVTTIFDKCLLTKLFRNLNSWAAQLLTQTLWNEERGHYDLREIDWDEFYEVLKGNGPCNRERIATRKTAIDERCLGASGCKSLRWEAKTKKKTARSCLISRRNKMSEEWSLYEVFIRSKHGLNHRHVGSACCR